MLNNKDPPLSFKKIRLFYECINIIISETGIPGNNNSFNRDKIMKKKQYLSEQYSVRQEKTVFLRKKCGQYR